VISHKSSIPTKVNRTHTILRNRSLDSSKSQRMGFFTPVDD